MAKLDPAAVLDRLPPALNTWAHKMLFRTYIPFVGAGIKVTHMAPDFRRIIVEMPLTPLNRNYVGTHFGGSLYAMLDPFYMIMVMKNLGPGHVVWDKAAHIDYVRPGRSKVRADFVLSRAQIDAMRARVAAANGAPVHLPLPIDVRDEDGVVVARAEKLLYVREKRAKAKKAGPSSKRR